MSYDEKNPSDKSGLTREQSVVIGVVVDNKDPNETGRIKVRIVGEQEDLSQVPDDKLPWYPVLTNGYSQTKGVGRFPAGGAYLPGTRIMMQNLGQQGFVVIGSLTNSETTPGKEDRHPESTSTSPVKVRDGQREHRRILRGGQQLNELETITSAVLSIMNSETPIQWTRVGPNDKKRGINIAAGSPQYNERESARIPEGQKPMPFSVLPWDLGRNSQRQVQSTPRSELIDGAVNMLESLKKTAETGSNPRMPNSIGGMNNIINALTSIMNLIKKHKKKKDEEDQQKEEELKRLQEENDELNNNPSSANSVPTS